jgi:hypothetical protein
MRRCWELLDHSSRSFSAVIKELDGDLARVVSLSLQLPFRISLLVSNVTVKREIFVSQVRVALSLRSGLSLFTSLANESG